MAALACGATILFVLHWRRRVVVAFAEAERYRVARGIELRLDEITGALMRRSFLEECEASLRDRRGSSSLALFMIDLDHLKTLNDSFGHMTGDFALRHLVRCVQSILPDALIGRLGGDEFGVLAVMDDEATCSRFAERLLHDLRTTFLWEGQPKHLSASIGIARKGIDCDFLSDLMQFADLALYAAKRSGRAQATFFRPDMLRDVRQTRFIERELRAAILLDELELAYQPIVDANGAVQWVEALVRWQHPVRGTIAPGDFVPVAEQSLLIDCLGEWVLRRACREFADLSAAAITVNVSVGQMRRDAIVEMTARVLSETGMDPSRLIFEVTETVAATAASDMRTRLQALRAMGIRIALDDFGTGFCGFAHLRAFPIDIIKIDRSFVSRLGDNHGDNMMVTALAGVAQAMDLLTLAEGVETQEQLRLSHAAGCSLFQGYAIARPMTKAGTIRWIDANASLSPSASTPPARATRDRVAALN